MMQDDPLPPGEQPAFDALPRAIDPPPGLEDRVVGRLRAAGALRSRLRASPAMWLTAAAALLVVGFAMGRFVPPAQVAPAGPRYLLLLYGGEAATPEETAARVAEYAAWAREEAAAGRVIGGERLGDNALVLGDDGPERAERPNPVGFFVIRASAPADAEATAARCPHLRHGGAVVLRRIVETGVF